LNRLFFGKAKALRKDIASFLNEYCKRKGVAYEADPRSNAERGLPPPEPTIPRWNILFHKRTGKKTAWLERRDREREARAAIAALEQECAELERMIATARSQDVVASNFDLITEVESIGNGFASRQPVREGVPAPTRTVKADRQARPEAFYGVKVQVARDRLSKRWEAGSQIEPDEFGGPPLSGFP
jgi:hypothetical protein